MKVTAIIQARMTSTRLPGKVLMEVMGRPLLSYQVERLRFSKRIADIIIATTVNREDDPIAELARMEGVDLFRGSELDVLDRYYQAAKLGNSRHIARFTADCPLIDPKICDQLVEKYFFKQADYLCMGPSFAEGLGCELFSFAALEKAWEEADLKSEREHVTRYFHNHLDKFHCITIENETDDSKYRVTVDEKKDFLVVKALFENLYVKNEEPCSISEIKNFLDVHPEIFSLNAGIVRNEGLLKSLIEDGY